MAHRPPPLMCAACYHIADISNMITHNLLLMPCRLC
nr:MAG TPA: hypothetical protein [Caudoviricetes sp.]